MRDATADSIEREDYGYQGRGVSNFMNRTTRRKPVRKKGRTAMLVLSATMAVSAVFAHGPAAPLVYAAQLPDNAISQAVQEQSEPLLQFIKEDIVTSGAVLRTYKWYPVINGQRSAQSTDLRVLVIDLHNPYVKLDVMSGKEGQVNSKQSVLGMARETGAVAGVNGSFFHLDRILGNPLGVQIMDYQMTVSPLFLYGWYSFGITTDRIPVIGEYEFDGSVMTADGAVFELRGINKPVMRNEVNNELSHTDSIFMYTSSWGPHQRAADSVYRPTEVLVIDGVVTKMAVDQALDVVIPENGYVLRGEGAGAAFLQQHVKVGDPLYTRYQMIDRNTGTAIDPNRFQMLIGGHTLLVDNGVAAPFTANVSLISGYSAAARTAVGYSADGRYVYLLTADKTVTSRGMTLAELQQAMIQLGVWRGINLDGGGSTTMVARELGDTNVTLVNTPSQTTMRQVVNGIGVYTTAPQGTLAGLIFDAIPFLFVGERVSLTARGYDQFYNPVPKVDFSEPGFSFEVPDGYGRFEGGYFIPEKTGKANIIIRRGSMEAATEVEIVDRKDIERLSIEGAGVPIGKGSMLKLKVIARLKDGRSREVPAEAIQWRVEGFAGSVKDGVLTVEDVEDYAKTRLIATYEGMSTTAVLPTYVHTLWANFDTIAPAISLNLIDPLSVIDYKIANREGQATSTNVLSWRYDYSATRQYSWIPLPSAAFEFNGGIGTEVAGSPTKLSIDVLGDGKSSKLWFEATDAAGQQHKIWIGQINWTGWRTVEVDLGSLPIQYPMTIHRLVHESPANPFPNIDLAFVTEEELLAMVDPNKVRGELAIDNIVFKSVHMPVEDPVAKTIEMQINNPIVSINGQQVELDQAPIVIGNSTMVPIRFVIEAIDGQVAWDPESNKVTLIKGKDYVEMWLNEQEMNFNGRKVTAPVAPTALNMRTLVPVRVLFEQLGWDVSWNGETQTVTIVVR